MNTLKQAENLVKLLVTKGFSFTGNQGAELFDILETELGFAFQQGKIANQAI